MSIRKIKWIYFRRGPAIIIKLIKLIIIRWWVGHHCDRRYGLLGFKGLVWSFTNKKDIW
jgi:hypothetical protein